MAQIYQEGYNDARHALEALRQAHDLDPMYLPAIGELARFFDRQSDVQSMRVHLDRAAARVRSILESDPDDAAAYHALFQMFGWRRAGDRAAMAAGILEYLGAATPEEKGVLAKAAARDGYPGTALADPALDDTLFDPRIPAGFRHLFRLLDEPLSKLFRADPKQLGLTRQERVPRSGHPLRDLAMRIAGDLGVREFDVYVTAAHPKVLLVELTDPPSLVLGVEVVGGASELELRFLLGRCLKMMQAHMALPMRLPEPELGVLLGGILRQFVPDFLPSGVDEQAVAAEAGRLVKLVPKKLHTQLLPFALECASDALNPAEIAAALVETANRAGLLISGSVGPALSALRRLGDERQVRVLLRFAVSEELGELRRQVGTSLG